MAARTLSHRTILSAIAAEITYTASRLIAHEEGTPFVPVFVGLREKCILVQNQEQMRRDAIVDAQALVDHVDDAFDLFVKKLVRVIDVITGEDRNHPLYRHFLGNKTPSEFSRPVLGPQLDSMTAWHSSLQSSVHEPLKALAPELAALLLKGNAAAKGKADAELARDQFRDVGERYKLIEEVNAKRKDLHGSLAKLPHEKDALPNNFADRFFRRESRTKDDDDTLTTTAEVDEAIKALEKQIAALNERRDEIVADADKVTKAKVKEQEDALAALAKKKAEVEAEEAAIKAKIEAMTKK